MWCPWGRKESKADRIKRMLANMNVGLDPQLLNELDSNQERWKSFANGLLIGLGIGAFLGLYIGVGTLRGRK